MFAFGYAVLCESTCAKSTFPTTYVEHWNAMLSRASRLWIVRLLTSWLVTRSVRPLDDIAPAAAVKQMNVSAVRS